jgi:hypothetical protein
MAQGADGDSQAAAAPGRLFDGSLREPSPTCCDASDLMPGLAKGLDAGSDRAGD